MGPSFCPPKGVEDNNNNVYFTRIEPPTVLSKIKILIQKVPEGSGVGGLRSSRLFFLVFSSCVPRVLGGFGNV